MPYLKDAEYKRLCDLVDLLEGEKDQTDTNKRVIEKMKEVLYENRR